MNRWRHSNSVPRKCHTQLELKPHLDSTHEKLTFSCPARTACRSTHSTISNRNKSSSFFRKNDLEEKLSPSKSKSIDLSNNLPMENKNESNTSSQVCLSFNGILNENMAGVDDIFDKEISGHIFSCSSSSKEQDFSQPSTSPKNSTNLNIMINASSIPFSVKQLYDVVKTNYSDFAFIYALSSQLCQDRVPMECFVTLKIGLLLSLVSIGNNEYQSPIPIVAMTNDTYVTDYLMSNIGQLGSRFLGPVNETKSFSKSNWIEADAIILAGGGVYYAGDWACLKLRRAETIFKSIECSNVPVEKSTLNFSLVTAIWTHWRPNQYRARDQQVFNKFLKIFGIPIFVSDDNHETLIDYTLQQASIRIFESTVDHLSINEEDMRSFLIRVSQINVDLSPEASHLLKAYFVASRSTRQDCLSKQSYIMLKQFAESFAKLSMRKIVLSEDALAAIIMCEHFIENVFGSSVNSPPLFGNFTFVGTVDTYLNQFKLWLDSYIENFTNN